jgi:hypothetical protein
MKIQEHYASLGANYHTLRSIKARQMFDTLEGAYEFWKAQQDKKDKLKQLADTLGISVDSVKQRGYRRGYYKVDDTLLETKWNIFEFEGESLALSQQAKKHNVNERTVTRHYNKHGDWVAAMNHARSVRVIIALNSVAAQCESLGLNYKRVESCAFRRQITKQQAIEYCLYLDELKNDNK